MAAPAGDYAVRVTLTPYSQVGENVRRQPCVSRVLGSEERLFLERTPLGARLAREPSIHCVAALRAVNGGVFVEAFGERAYLNEVPMTYAGSGVWRARVNPACGHRLAFVRGERTLLYRLAFNVKA